MKQDHSERPDPPIHLGYFAPRIPHALRHDFESSLPKEPGQENYQILQYELAKKPSPSPNKAHYFPIQYVMPETERHVALGLDLSSIAHWEGLLEKSFT